MQFVARQLFRQTVFNQAVARQPVQAFECRRNDAGEKVVAVAFYFDKFAGGNGLDHFFYLFGMQHVGVLKG